MKKREESIPCTIYSNDSGTEEIREIKGISIMNRRRRPNGEWGPWINIGPSLAKEIIVLWKES